DVLHHVHDPGVVDEDVELAELLYGALDQRLGVLALGDVAYDRDHLAARGLRLGHDGLEAGSVDVAGDDRRTLAREQQGRRPPHTRSRSGDDGYLACEPHGYLRSQANQRWARVTWKNVPAGRAALARQEDMIHCVS